MGRHLLLTSIGYFILKLYQQRVFFRRTVKKYNLPTLPNHSWLLGNLIAVGKIMAKYPGDVHGQLMPDFLARDYPEIAELGMCYIDLWPISWPMLVTFHPDIAAQFTQETPRPKHEIIRGQFRPLTGLKDLVLSEGAFWEKWRATFNPGFSTQNITALVPEFIEEASIWKKYLQEVAEDGRVVPLENCVMKATCDIIGRSVLGISLGIQTGSPHQWGRLLNPLRQYRLSSLNRQLRSQLQPLIEAQLQNHERNEGPKTVNGLAIKTYMKEYGSEGTSGNTIDPEFLDVTIENLKIFLFAGHDTTASTLCFAYNYLYQHPDNRLSDLVEKALRQFFLRHPETGQQHPTDGFILFSASKAIHRNPKFWSEPDKFIPERWLDPVVHKNAFRPFELGPRGCIGQELALTELRLLLAMTVRELEIVPAYKEKDEILLGYQAYQAQMPGELTAHPSKGMPVTVRLRKVRNTKE
ncbi:sterigmatocystin biosynthesis protein [Fusarium phyllophilum]|uniref:Sterigmatocystin biosynthesis protein n=1 Tax=Fusarium phyllophilum TaxID=47803 RepID=A0A8H5JS67_9HYPO|nr:sterigmatocystin biosynthesis protein [Fusarium phyllophilum]